MSTPMTADQKGWIDSSPYKILLWRWRYGIVGDTIFQGESGEYYSKVMADRRALLGPEVHTQASKEIGWHDQ